MLRDVRRQDGRHSDQSTPDRSRPAGQVTAADVLLGGGVVGRITSAERSPALDRAIGLGWVRSVDGGFPDRLTTASGATATVETTPFYDPDGEVLRS